MQNLAERASFGGLCTRAETWKYSFTNLFFTVSENGNGGLQSPLLEQNIPTSGVFLEIPEHSFGTNIPAGNMGFVGSAAFLPAIFFLIWLTGVFFLTILAIRAALKVRCSVRFAVKTDEPDVWESDQIQGPFVRGLFRARIYLPSSANPEHRRYILLHERYHIHRKDNFILLLAQILVILLWFHPLIWLARELMRRDMEISCDEKATAGLEKESIADYSAALLACGAGQYTAFAASMGNRKSILSLRIKAVMTEKKKSFFVPAAAAAVCLAGTACCFLLFSGAAVSVTGNVQYDAAADTAYPENRNDTEKPAEATVGKTADSQGLPDLTPAARLSPEAEASPPPQVGQNTGSSAGVTPSGKSADASSKEEHAAQNLQTPEQAGETGSVPDISDVSDISGETNRAGQDIGGSDDVAGIPVQQSPLEQLPTSLQNPQIQGEAKQSQARIISYDPDTGITVWQDASGSTVFSGLPVP